eukprot:TRINITY_DN6167_c0_g1_i2.p1 TRINITY_DN6167_c0_g1~~TRINITY_DN6167_c0_g1_i2.p1  ORF type:complete len:408 (-),score=43.23 TRINITY_DN6167_c0_g1_i2:1-1224(-)
MSITVALLLLIVLAGLDASVTEDISLRETLVLEVEETAAQNIELIEVTTEAARLMRLIPTGKGNTQGRRLVDLSSIQFFSSFDPHDKNEWVDINRHLPFANECKPFFDNAGFATISRHLVNDDGSSVWTWAELRERVLEVTGRDHLRVLVSYAHQCCYHSMTKQCGQGLVTGAFDVFIAHGKNDMGTSWATRTSNVLDTWQGGGLWSWKSEIIASYLRLLNAGDYIVYSDAPTDWLVDAFDDWAYHCTRVSEPWGICLFSLPYAESAYTKRDTFVKMGCDTEACHHLLNLLGGTHVWRVSDKALEFALRWRDAVADIDKVSQNANVMGLPNLPGFVEHRHDQSILSILAFQVGLNAFRDPSQYGFHFDQELASPNSEMAPWRYDALAAVVKRSTFFGQIVNHTRVRT